MAKKHKQTHKHAPKQTENVLLWKISTAVFAVLFVISLMTGGFQGTTTTTNSDGSTVAPSNSNSQVKGTTTTTPKKVELVDGALPVELYVMSQCPYGVKAEDAMFKAIQDIGLEYFDLNVDFIASAAGDGFKSLHGEPEVQGDLVQLCARQYNPESFLDLVLCMNEDPSKIPGNWESCSNKLGLDAEAISTCYEGDEGKELLTKSIANADSRGASASPTIYVGGTSYSGARGELDFKRAFCNGFEKRPAACADIPEPVRVDVTVINDVNCPSCDTSGIIAPTKNFFPGAVITEVDMSEAQDLIEKYDIEVLPAYIFDAAVTNTEMVKGSPDFMGNFDSLSDGSYKLKDAVTQATWFVSEEKRAERLDAMGITSGDNDPQIDFFVMSYCPYGNEAEKAIFEAYKELGDKAEFKPHYIYYENYQGGGPTFCMDDESKYCSMHGVQEANQNIREQCVAQKYGVEGWFDFSIAMDDKCTSTNADTCWESVASDLGYDTTFIASCEKENALTFAAQDAELMSLFGASGSPSVYIDGQTYTGPRSGTGFLAGLCDAYDGVKPASCDGVVVEQAAPTAAAPAGACG